MRRPVSAGCDTLPRIDALEAQKLKRVRPTCTERKSLAKECGWKGDGAAWLYGIKFTESKRQNAAWTSTGLLMEGLSVVGPRVTVEIVDSIHGTYGQRRRDGCGIS